MNGITPVKVRQLRDALQGRIERAAMKAFLSYASERRSTARIVYQFCKKCGIDIFFDRVSIVGGQDWNQEIKRGQSEADITLLVLSKESLAKPGVLQEEIHETLRMIERRPLGDIYLVVLRAEPVPLPPEMNRWQYIDLFKRDWRTHLAQTLRQKASLMKQREPKGLRLLLSGGPAEHKPAHIRYRNQKRKCTLTADYFTYHGSGRYWDYINAEIFSEANRGFYENLYYSRVSGQMAWQLRIDEFFREGDLISLTLSHYVDAGGAHPSYGVTTMNFGGDQMGKIRLGDIVDTAEDTFAFIKRYCELDLRKQFGSEERDTADLSHYVELDHWKVFEDFNIDKLGLVINLTPNQGLPYVMGANFVRIPWEDLRGRLDEEFCKTKPARRLRLAAHARTN